MELEIEQWDDAYSQVAAIAAWSAYQRFTSLLSGHMSPRQQADYDRLSKPQIGDLVLETSSLSRHLGYEDWESVNRSLGVLVDMGGGNGGPSPATAWTVLSLAPPGDPAVTYWENARFIVVELPPVKPLCPHCKGEDPDNCPKKRIPWHPDNEKNGYCAGGRWVYPVTMTRESLVGALAADGIEVPNGPSR